MAKLNNFRLQTHIACAAALVKAQRDDLPDDINSLLSVAAAAIKELGDRLDDATWNRFRIICLHPSYGDATQKAGQVLERFLTQAEAFAWFAREESPGGSDVLTLDDDGCLRLEDSGGGDWQMECEWEP